MLIQKSRLLNLFFKSSFTSTYFGLKSNISIFISTVSSGIPFPFNRILNLGCISLVTCSGLSSLAGTAFLIKRCKFVFSNLYLLNSPSSPALVKSFLKNSKGPRRTVSGTAPPL